MAKWLTQEWLDESTRLAASQPERLGIDVSLQYRITGGPEGEVTYYWVIRSGRLEENRLGILDGAEVTLVEDYFDAMAIQKGELDINAAFMEGKVRVEGDVAKLLSLLPITTSDEFQEFSRAVTEITEY